MLSVYYWYYIICILLVLYYLYILGILLSVYVVFYYLYVIGCLLPGYLQLLVYYYLYIVGSLLSVYNWYAIIWILLQLNGEGDWECEEITLERVSTITSFTHARHLAILIALTTSIYHTNLENHNNKNSYKILMPINIQYIGCAYKIDSRHFR